MSTRKYSNLLDRVIDLGRYEGICISGLKGWGKSALAEVLAEEYFLRGWLVMDVLGAPDWESCFWAVPGPRGFYYKTLLIHPPRYELRHTDAVTWGHIKFMASDTPLEEILQTAKNEDRVITTASLWPHGSISQLLTPWFFELIEIAHKLKNPIFLVLKEAHMAFSHLKVFDKLETKFRASLLNLFRSGRHHEIGFCLDLQRMVSLYKEIRDLTDKTILKRNTQRSVPRELEFVFSELDEIRETFHRRQWRLRERNYPLIQKLWPSECYCLGSDGQVLPVVRTPLPRFWHKKPKDRFLEITGIQVVKRGDGEFTVELLEEEALPPVKEQIYRCAIEHPDWGMRQIAREVDCSHSYVSEVLSFKAA